MKHRLPKYISGFRDRHGKMRFRFRKTGAATRYLANAPGTADFAEEYRTCLENAEKKNAIQSPSIIPGSLNALALSFYRSTDWTNANEQTQHVRKLILGNFLEIHGNRLVRDMQVQHIEFILSSMSDRPAAANKLRKLLKRMMDHAIRLGFRKDNPLTLVKGFSENTEGYHSWTDEELNAFEKRHPIGTKAHTAYAIMLYSGQRRSDARVFGRGHVADGVMSVRHHKTKHFLVIPVHKRLATALAAVQSGDATFLVTEAGKPFTSAGFGNWFRERCDEAGLYHCTAHGLRKAAGRRLAEAGCSANEIMSVLGVSLKIASVYTRAADQKRLAINALSRQTNHDQLANDLSGLANFSDIPL